ncbi:MAG: phosphate acetyltransferase [Spirochaetales bacterium]
MFDFVFRNKLERKLLKKAQNVQMTIALPEASFSGIIIEAAEYCVKTELAKVVLIGSEQKIKNTYLQANFEGITFIDPETYEKTSELAHKLYEIRKEKGLLLKEAQKLIHDPIYFATMLLNEGVVDGVVGGAATSTANMLRPALQIIKGEDGIKTISSSFIMINKSRHNIGDKGVVVLGDCAVNVDPTAEQLSDIGLATINTATKIAGLEPRVAMLSYSTHGSGSGESVDKVVKATKLLKEKAPDTVIEGELQADSALSLRVARVKCRNNSWKGDANVLIFPELNSGNIGYKLLKFGGNFRAIGPIMQGFRKPVNDLSRGATLKEIVLTIAITCIQANKLDEKEQAIRREQEKVAKALAKKELKEQKKQEKLLAKQPKNEVEVKEEEKVVTKPEPVAKVAPATKKEEEKEITK